MRTKITFKSPTTGKSKTFKMNVEKLKAAKKARTPGVKFYKRKKVYRA